MSLARHCRGTLVQDPRGAQPAGLWSPSNDTSCECDSVAANGLRKGTEEKEKSTEETGMAMSTSVNSMTDQRIAIKAMKICE